MHERSRKYSRGALSATSWHMHVKKYSREAFLRRDCTCGRMANFYECAKDGAWHREVN